MCDFCEHIYSYGEDAYPDRNYILYDRDAYEFDIEAVIADPYDSGILQGVKFCPYCGRKLSIKENTNGQT